VFKVGKRLVTKIFNAGKFVLSQTGERHPISTELDRAFAAKLRQLVEKATASQESFNYAQALQETESFFWSHFTDTYLELAKPRARRFEDGATGGEAAASGSAVASLRLGLNVLLRLLAPVLPYICEEVWSWSFAEESGCPSIHTAPWPNEEDFASVGPPANPDSFDLAIAALAAVNKCKADAEVSMGREIESLTLVANASTLEQLGPVLSDVLAASRCASHELAQAADLEDGAFEVRGAVFAPKPEKR